MSDLAPFVAEVLHDKVVIELMEEISKLKRKLYERDPQRSVQLKYPKSTTKNGEEMVVKEEKIHLGQFGGSRSAREGKLTAVFSAEAGYLLNRGFTLKHLRKLELWIDGVHAVSLGGLKFYYKHYVYRTDVEELGKYRIIVDGKLGDDFNIQFTVYDVPPETHAELLSRETPVDFPPPDDPNSPNSDLPFHRFGERGRMWRIEGNINALEALGNLSLGFGKEVSTDHMMNVLGEKVVSFDYDQITCTWAFMKEKLSVPFDSQNLVPGLH